jgi:hypothetical protein
MTYNRPGKGSHAINTTGAVIPHNAPVLINNLCGVAVKQAGRHWNEGLTTPERIELNERFWLIRKGIVQVAETGGAGTMAKGDAVYITAAGVLNETSAGNTKFGRVVETTGDGRGVPTGMVRIDLDAKDTI